MSQFTHADVDLNGGGDSATETPDRLPDDHDPGRELFVAPDGDDDTDGTEDAPLATIEAAQNRAREVIADGPPDGGVTVTLREGTYRRDGTLNLHRADSGTSDAPTVYRSYPGETATLQGGVDLPVSEFDSVQGDARERLPSDARSEVLQVDLEALGITEYGSIQKYGFGWPDVPAPPELLVDGTRQTIARWPNDGWVETGEVFDEGGVPRHGGDRDEGARFKYTHGDRSERWADTDDVWMFGYWHFDWADGNLKIKSIDVEDGVIDTVGASFYGVHEGQRYYYYNILEELDRPSEFYVDRDEGMLYLYPPEGFQDATVELSLTADPLVRAEGTDHLTLQGLTLETARGSGVVAQDCEDLSVEACTLHKLGGRAAIIRGGRRCGVIDCRIDRVGKGGVTLAGGDRDSLTPAEHYATNNRISRFSRVVRTYTPAVALHGVGNRATHNRLFDAPHMAISFDGNEHVIDKNEIDHVAQETSDVGAIYNGRDWTHRGTVIRHNFFHHIGNDVGGVGQMAVYLDDTLPATRILGNVFYQVARVMLIGGGRSNEIINNLIVDCTEGITIDDRGAPGNWAREKCVLDGGEWGMRGRLEEVPYREDTWKSTYPDLLESLDDEPCLPKNNVVRRNAFVGDVFESKMLDFADLAREHGTIENNVVHYSTPEEHGFTYQNGEASLADDNYAAENVEGWEPIPFGEIGVRVEGTNWEL